MAGAPPCIFTFLEPLLQAEQLLRRVCRVPIHVSCLPCQNLLLLGSGIYDHLGSMCQDYGIQDLGYGNQNSNSHAAFLHVGIRISIPTQRFCTWDLDFQLPCSAFACGNQKFNSHAAFLHVGIIISIPMQCFCIWEFEFQFPCSVFACGDANFNSHAVFLHMGIRIPIPMQCFCRWES